MKMLLGLLGYRILMPLFNNAEVTSISRHTV